MCILHSIFMLNFARVLVFKQIVFSAECTVLVRGRVNSRAVRFVELSAQVKSMKYRNFLFTFFLDAEHLNKK